MLLRIWRHLKVWRKIPLGPVSVHYRFDRSVPVTKGLRTRRSASVPRSSSVADARSRPQDRTDQRNSSPVHPLAVLVGVGPGFGFELAKHLAAEGFDLLLVCRTAESLSPLVNEVHKLGVSAAAYGVDATDEMGVAALFEYLEKAHGCPSLVVYSIQYFSPGLSTEVEVPAFEASWRHNCLGAFLVGRRAARAMESRGDGTIIFIGSTSSIVGREEHLNLAIGKFGQRALAQVMARELWAKGIHVAHVLIDADIQDGDQSSIAHPQSRAEDIAQSILYLHRQPRTAWTSEMDLRPWNERFWEHC
jgi:NAD(P)-dependent dehydrogenase (short-subunit alcohol dehydrogenase family)